MDASPHIPSTPGTPSANGTNGTNGTNGDEPVAHDRFRSSHATVSGRRIARLIREIIRDVGPSCTFARAQDALWKRHGHRMQEHTFDRHYREMFGRMASPPLHAPATPAVSDESPNSPLADDGLDDGEGREPPADTVDTADHNAMGDRLSAFIKFSMAVSAAGGTRVARRWLDMMDQLARSV